MISALSSGGPTVATAAAIALAALFIYAAATKLTDRDGTAADFEALGLGRARALAVLVPGAELGLAVALVVQPRLGGLAAIATLAAFTFVLSKALRKSKQRGAPVRCSCFGATNRDPVSTATLARNGALMIAAAVATTQSTLSRPDLAVLVAVSMLMLVPVIGVQLLITRRQLGRIWSVELAGERR